MAAKGQPSKLYGLEEESLSLNFDSEIAKLQQSAVCRLAPDFRSRCPPIHYRLYVGMCTFQRNPHGLKQAGSNTSCLGLEHRV